MMNLSQSTSLRVWMSGLIALVLLGVCGAAMAQSIPEPYDPATESTADELPTGDEAVNEAPQAEEADTEQGAVLQTTADDIALTKMEMDQIVKRFLKSAEQFNSDLANVVEDRYKRKEAEIGRKYDSELELIESKELQAISGAIEVLERFVKKYPKVKKYSPDAMFRLAELYYQKANREFDAVRPELIAKFEKELERFDEGLIDEEPEAPTADYNKSVALYKRIVNEFPNYRYIDMAWYLMAFCYHEMETKDAEGKLTPERDAFMNLVAVRPDSPYAVEAMLYTGDAYFRDLNYEKSLQILGRAAKHKESPLYDQILYKLASNHFIIGNTPDDPVDHFQKSVELFIKLADYSEEMKKKTGDESMFVQEALQYVAVCYSQSEDYWTKTGINNATAYFDSIGDRPYEWRVFMRLGDNFAGQDLHLQAISAYQRVLQKDPMNPEAPEIQNKIIDIYTITLRDMDHAASEREKLAENYLEGSAWYEANKENPEVLKKANTLARNALYQFAIYLHAQAQRYNELEQKEDAKLFYKRAAKGYKDFLTRFPHAKESYQVNYMMADALFYGGYYEEAVEQYLKVRSSRQGVQYFDDASYMVVLCYDILVSQQSQNAEVTASEEEQQETLQEAQEERKLKGKVQAQAIPGLEKKYVEAADFYNANVKSLKDQEVIAWRSGEIFFKYKHFDKARERYLMIVERWPKSKRAVYAARRIVDTYNLEEDWLKVTEWAQKLASLELSDEESLRKFRSSMKELRGKAAAQYAKELQARGEYEKAAEEYLKIVNEAPDGPDAPVALFNAAANYSAAKRPALAMTLFERQVKDYPDSPFAAEALYKVASNAFDSYNLDKASESYRLFYTKYRQQVENQPGRDPKENKKDICLAIFNHALLKEFNHEYKQAAQLYTKYSEECEGIEDDVAVQLLKAAKLYEKIQAWRTMMKTLERFIERFQNKREMQVFVVEGYMKIGDAWFGLNNDYRGYRNYQKAVDFFDGHPAIHSILEANNAAGKAKFMLIDREFKKYLGIKLQGGDRLADSFKKKQEAMLETIASYKIVRNYKSPEFILAAGYRQAQAAESFADAIFDAPIPREIRRIGEDAVMMYEERLDELARPLYTQAANAYMNLFEQGRQLKLFTSPWFKKVIEALQRPNMQQAITGTYKMRKEEISAYSNGVTLALPLHDGQKPELKKPEILPEEETAPAGEATPAEGTEATPAEGTETAPVEETAPAEGTETAPVEETAPAEESEPVDY